MNGVDTEELYIVTPPDGDAAVDLVCAAMEDPEVCLVIFDAVPGLVSSYELTKSSEDALKPGAVAGPLQRMLRKCSTIVAQSYAKQDYKTMILINQWRDGISMGPTPAARSVPGGKYARHYNSVEVELYNTENVGKAAESENGVQIVATNDHTFKIHKNKTGNSIRSGEFILVRGGPEFPAGTIDDYNTVLSYATKYDLRGGAGKGMWLVDPETGEQVNFAKKDDMRQHLIDNPEQYELLKRLIISKHRKGQGLNENGWW